MRRNQTETVTLDASGTLIKVALSTLDKLRDTMLGKLVLNMLMGILHCSHGHV